jgi:hypothetical protein
VPGAAGRVLFVLVLGVLPATAAPVAAVRVHVAPTEATVGDPLQVSVEVELPPGSRLEPPPIGPQWGAFQVRSGAWSQAEPARWVWSGELSAFETGELALPPIVVRVEGPDGASSARSEPQTVTIRSVLNEGESAGDAAPADIKPPASLEPDYGSLVTALAVLGLLLAASLGLWWLHRRYGSRLAARPVPDDPFHRLAPHVWIYAELQRLLEQRLPEQGQVERFYSELSRILKRYLSGRYRVELLERTTGEVPASLQQAGAAPASIGDARALLEGCDRVKFARATPGPEDWKSAIETVYRIVDQTRPAEAGPRAASAGSG